MRGKWLVIGGAVGAAALAAAAWAFGRPTYEFATIATTFAAKQTCSCLFVSGRDMASCRTDFPPEELEQISITAEGQSVRASVLGGAISARADYEEGFGCRVAA